MLIYWMLWVKSIIKYCVSCSFTDIRKRWSPSKLQLPFVDRKFLISQKTRIFRTWGRHRVNTVLVNDSMFIWTLIWSRYIHSGGKKSEYNNSWMVGQVVRVFINVFCISSKFKYAVMEFNPILVFIETNVVSVRITRSVDLSVLSHYKQDRICRGNGYVATYTNLLSWFPQDDLF
jgi:hypothetical protein